MTKEDNSGLSDSAVFGIILVIFLGGLFYPLYLEMKDLFIDFRISINWFYIYFTNLFLSAYHSLQIIMPLAVRSVKFYSALFIILLPFILIANYKLHYKLIKWKEKRKSRKQAMKDRIIYLSNKRKEVIDVIEKPIENLTSIKLKEIKNILYFYIDKNYFPELKDKISDKISKIKSEIPLVVRRERISELSAMESLAEKRVQLMEEEIQQREIKLRNFEETSLRKLNANDNNVYVESDLAEKEKDLLMKYGYKRAYEYCVYEKDYIRVLVKPTMKHSVTHTFLVWSVMRILLEMKDVTNIVDHDTRDADITFQFKKKRFALEIETGTLLSKKVQLRAKIDYLNSRYKDHWMIIVSKKALLSKYSKFGPVSSRAEVEKRLQKLLKNP